MRRGTHVETARRGVSTVFIFVDGVGLGAADPETNPTAHARLPTIQGLLDGRRPVREAAPYRAAGASLVGLDATLGVPGLPQSGTGHATLLTGENAAHRFGRHFGPWVPTALRPELAEQSIFARALRAGRSVAFANACPEELLETDRCGGRTPIVLRTGPFLAARATGLLSRHTRHLARGEAVASEITNRAWRERLGRRELPRVTPAEAGRRLAAIAARHDLTFFAHYATDAVGHRGTRADAVAALERVDAFLGGVLETRSGADMPLRVIVASDHGNIEDTRGGHTRNPALALVVGRDHAEMAARLRDLTDVTPAVLGSLGM